MKYPKYDVYEALYKRYFKKGVQYLMDPITFNKNDKVLDLCGGNGRLTKELKKQVENVTYLDQEKDMIPEDLEKLGIKVLNQSVQSFIDHPNQTYDKVFCEQAINYWLLEVDPKKLSQIFRPNGVFVFNTFSKKPSTKPMIKEYVIDGVTYLEIAYLVGNKVEHIQVREGYAPHITTFDWISRDTYEKLLGPYFDIQVQDDGKSALYILRRKK